MSEPMITKPTIHLNGTSRESLCAGYKAAATAIQAAIGALIEAQPSARDYYLQGNDAFGRARAEHAARLAALQEVLGELSELWESVQ